MSASSYLIVEDEEAHAELLRRALEERAEVAVAPSLAQARELLSCAERSFDLVLTDLRLPDGLGVTLLADGRDIPIVIMTSQGDEQAAVEAIKSGAYDYIVKSTAAFEEMPRTAERVLREWRHEREQRELRRALAERDRLAAIGTAAAMLAHEIGNPLNSMSLSAQLIERRLAKLDADTSSIAEIVATCRREIDRLASLLSEFRGLARESDLTLDEVDLGALLESALTIPRPMLREAGVELEVTMPDEPVRVLANEAKMTQVMLNLCKNAVEAMPGGGRISIRAAATGETVTLEVADDGPGLPEGLDVFAPLASTKPDGTGLGLAVVAQILASHGGTVTAGNGADGGACFSLRLPRASQAE